MSNQKLEVDHLPTESYYSEMGKEEYYRLLEVIDNPVLFSDFVLAAARCLRTGYINQDDREYGGLVATFESVVDHLGIDSVDALTEQSISKVVSYIKEVLEITPES